MGYPPDGERQEPIEILGDDLLERLKTTRNRADIAILLLKLNRHELIYTVLEDLHYGTQNLIDKYCIKE